ncbi:hypothetical protein CPB83DRAFT_856293 [Crepidotus variabilis]|uniref:F-box domain-containing protein n=1 Tax=Crepidotus variabilis TaxID=179855 RepID=A0A9P6JP43_9AGAR|nr:hypothetical protein CPB83DRAFT_856293 [Crepidotus variabilis]
MPRPVFQRRISSKLAISLGRHGKFLESPIPGLVSSNDPPSDAERIAATEAIVAAESRLKNEKVLASPGYDYHTQPLVEYIQAHRAVLSPARKLPTELLREIFAHYFATCCAHAGVDPFDNCPPWELAQICRLWREIAISMAWLWRHLPRIHFAERKDNLSAKQHLKLLETLLRWSADNPLTFFLSKRDHKESDAILLLLFRHSERWERVSLNITELVCAHFSRLKGKLQSLEFIDLQLLPSGRLHVNMFQEAPRLQEVHISLGPLPGFMYLPWSQLTVYREESREITALMNVLAHASKVLQRLDFELIDGSSTTMVVQIPHRQYPRLTRLALRSTHGPPIATLLEWLTMPTLEDLTLHDFGGVPVLPPLLSFIQRSACTLKSLSLHSLLSTSQIISVLRLTPHLHELDLNYINDDLVKAFTATENLENFTWKLLPELESLTIHVDLLSQGLLHHIPKLAQARCDLVIPSPEEGLTNASTHFCPLKLAVASKTSITCIENLGFSTNASLEWRETLAATKMVIDEEVIKAASWHIGSFAQDTRKEKLAKVIRRFEHILELLEGFGVNDENVPYFYYERINISLWKLFLVEPLLFHQKLKFNARVEALLIQWADVMERLYSQLRWLWDEQGFLRYEPSSVERMPQVSSFKQFFLDKSSAQVSNVR